MIIGYLLVGIFAGLGAFVVTLARGGSLWMAFGLYSLVGSLCLVFVPLTRLLIGSLVDRVLGFGAVRRARNAKEDDIQAAREARHADGAESGLRILAVDDDPFILDLIPIIANKVGFPDVTLATSAKEALRLIGTAAEPFDLLLLDIAMPGMDGVELCGLVRELPGYRDTPIMMLTAARDFENLDRAFKAGASDYATKPFEISDFAARLKGVQVQSDIRKQLGAAAASVPMCPSSGLGDYDGFEHARLQDVISLVECHALGNYLRQLSQDSVINSRVVAIKVDRIGELRTALPSQKFGEMIFDVAKAISATLATSKFIMTYLGDGTFVTISNVEEGVPSDDREADIQSFVNETFFASLDLGGTPVTVTIGAPVQPPVRMKDRAKIAFDLAVSSVEARQATKPLNLDRRPIALVVN